MTEPATARVKLRRLQESDYEKLRLLEADPLVMQYSSPRVPQTEEQTRARLASQMEKQESRAPFGIWLAESKLDGSFLGWFMLLPEEQGILELGYMLVRAQWGKGYTTEIGKVLVEFALGQPSVNGIIAKTNIENVASARVLEKLGFRYVETKSFPDKVFGGEVNLKVFSKILQK